MAKTTKPEKKTDSRAKPTSSNKTAKQKASKSKQPREKPVEDDIPEGEARTGRPPLYETPEALEQAVELYFLGLDIDSDNPKTPTIAGLAYALGFESRQSMYDYEGRGESFSYVIKRARLAIERHHESRLSGTTPTGSIFWLKNHAGYVDKSEVDMTTMTAEQRKKRLAALLAKAAQK